MRAHYGQASRHRSHSNACHEEKLQRQANERRFVAAGGPLVRGRLRLQLAFSLMASLLIVVSFRLDALQFFSQIPVLVPAATGFLLPLGATLL
jgi:hypothetical protein